jgi:hypothetical protein
MSGWILLSEKVRKISQMKLLGANINRWFASNKKSTAVFYGYDL